MPASGSKPRGCFQCSKRRITCDGAEPTCKKCQKKGIECSGLGRIRFTDGIARRGKLKGCAIPVEGVSAESAFQEHQQQNASFNPRRIQWRNETPQRGRKRAVRRGNAATEGGRVSEGCDTEVQDDVDEEVERVNDQALVRSSTASIAPWIAPLNSKTRMLFSHFAQEVAPVMVILDNVCNGYRDLLLPMACQDELLQRAVGAVAAQHLSFRQPHLQSVAESSRTAIISRLRQDSLQASPDRVFNVSTWATLIVLLVGETITGSSEYSHLLHILMCLAQNIGQLEHTSANGFLMQQTHMFEFLGQPLLGETQGIHALRLPPDHYLDWIMYDLPPDSEHNHVIHLCRLAFIKASQIYIGRATANQDQWELLESLKELVTQVDPNAPGSHALVWVCFIAAADSTDPEHRRFFTERMNNIFAKTKFRNISAAIEALPAIWSQQGSGRWTEELIRLAPTLIM